MWSRRLAARSAVLVAMATCSGSVAAAPKPPPHVLSEYEKESIRLALADIGAEREPSPEGKRVEDIDIVTLDVIEKRDPFPRFLNALHVTTRPVVIRREMLLHPGDLYDADLVEETARNLRQVPQLSVVLIVPTKAEKENWVRLLVITKDVWSLRPNLEPVFVNGNLQTLAMQAQEQNLLGRHKIITANIVLTRPTYLLGLGYTDPRIGGSRLAADGDANLVFNCRTGAVEGSTGDFSYGKPLYSTRTKWGWNTSIVWADGIVRPAGTTGQSVCSGDHAVELDFAATPYVDHVPYQYREDILDGEFAAVRSFGVAHKSDLAFGLEADRRVFEPPDLSAEPLIVRAEFQKLLPVSDTRLSPFVQLHEYENAFQRVLDIESLGLQEDFRLGYDAWLKVYPATKALGSTRNLIGLYGALGYTLPLSNGFTRVYAYSNLQISNPDQTDGVFKVGGRFVTPRLPFGRVVLDGYVLDRFDNYLNPNYSLGGTTRLRGYRTQAFVGPNVVVGNVEVRSRPIEVLSVQMGVAAFYDVGDAFRDFSVMKLKQGVGGGLRFVFPQAQRAVFRVDLGFPLSPSDPAADTTIVAEFEQAFPVPALVSPGLGL